jgi:hypothetical protein
MMEKHLPSVFLVAAALAFWWRLEPRLVGERPIAERVFAPVTQWLLLAMFLAALAFSSSSREIPFLYFQF